MTTTTRRAKTRRATSTATPAQRADWSAARDARLTELHEQVTAGVAALADSDAWRAMLNTARRFHRYSLGNLLLIGAQRPEATQVAGFGTWKALGRQVRKGERGVSILAPCPIRTTNDTDTGGGDVGGEAPAARLRWKVATVFDVAQTDGDPIATPADLVTLPQGDLPPGLWDGLAAQVAAHGYTLERGDCGTARGFTNPTTMVVRVTGEQVDAAATKTLAHELAHVVAGHVEDLPTYATCRGRCEIEAESIAYVVTGAQGLDTSAYSFGYVAVWADGHPDQVRDTAATVIRCARTILDQLATEADTDNDTEADTGGE